MKTRSSLVKLINNGKVEATLCHDGYFLDSRGRKLFVLKKEPLQFITTILEDFQESDSTYDPVSNQVVKYNGNHSFETHNIELFYELLGIIYNKNSIKFPQDYLFDALDNIQDNLSWLSDSSVIES